MRPTGEPMKAARQGADARGFPGGRQVPRDSAAAWGAGRGRIPLRCHHTAATSGGRASAAAVSPMAAKPPRANTTPLPTWLNAEAELSSRSFSPWVLARSPGESWSARRVEPAT